MMRPFVHVNCAMSADGKIAGPDRKQVTISSDEDKKRVKALRRQYDSILVGVGTVIADDPHLTIKGASFEANPVRIVMDPNGRTPDGALVLNDAAPTVIITSSDREWHNAVKVKCTVPVDMNSVLGELAGMGIESILVEGGGETISTFFRAGAVDRYTVFVGDLIIGGKDSPTPADGIGWIGGSGIRLKFKGAEVLGNGVLITYES